MAINLHIERLVLDGLPVTRHQGGQIQAAIEMELTRLLSTQGFVSPLSSGFAMPLVKADAVQIAGNHEVGQMGTQIAQSVYRSINGA